MRKLILYGNQNVLKGYIEDMLPKLNEQNKGKSDVLDDEKVD